MSDNLKEAVVAQEVLKCRNNNPNRSCSDELCTHKYPVQEDVLANLSLSDENIGHGYLEGALIARCLLHGEDLRLAWTGALRALPFGVGLRFTIPEYDIHNYLHERIQPHCVAMTHFLIDRLEMEIYEIAAAPVGDALLTAAVACMAKADMKPGKLNVMCAMTRQFQWEALPGWEKCDFSQVQSFEFHPRIPRAPCDWSRAGEIGTLITTCAADAIAAVLKRCNESLEEFHCRNDCPMRWPGYEVISLPKLKRLSFTCGYIRPRNLAAWMTRMPSLEHFECVSTYSLGGEEGTWLDVFDAIRNHSRGMKVVLHNILTADEGEPSLGDYTYDLQKYFETRAPGEDRSDNTLRIPWNLYGEIDTATMRALRS